MSYDDLTEKDNYYELRGLFNPETWREFFQVLTWEMNVDTGPYPIIRFSARGPNGDSFLTINLMKNNKGIVEDLAFVIDWDSPHDVTYWQSFALLPHIVHICNNLGSGYFRTENKLDSNILRASLALKVGFILYLLQDISARWGRMFDDSLHRALRVLSGRDVASLKVPVEILDGETHAI
jgi:hypothetical protein